MKTRHKSMQIILEPENTKRQIFGAATVLSMLNKLGLKSTQALVIRNNTLLTPDEKIHPDDEITVRVVASRG
ncbi:hypothetical protein [Desulfonatronovibrio magnus]|uniref:hypothetical protein n=1 Tax=Desulfonatronovibrio magnus TaxID=698827 RepID=UPI001E4ABA6F|nr:hypothetical protein [Desulfonatronovibrio magnus]